jgi:ABC-type multidrug transport system fused ATPase/permease subunit
VLTYLTDDAETFESVIYRSEGYIRIPIQIIIGTVVVSRLIGWGIVGTFAVLAVGAFISSLIMKRVKKIEKQHEKAKDSRNQFIEEVISGIRYIKMSGWEGLFKRKFAKKSEVELGHEYNRQKMDNYEGLTVWVADAAMKFAAFLAYIYTHD